MIYGSVFSGIEAATVAWHPLGWKSAWFSEIAKFPSAVLAHHYPTVPNLGDMTTIGDRIAKGEITAPDVLVGGSPCQAFSFAGLRNSLADKRGQLTLEYVRLANNIDSARLREGKDQAVVVWENVLGALSTKDNAFGHLVGALSGSGCELQPAGGKWTHAGCVYGPQRTVAWRVLDAQYFSLAQRRKRIVLVASARSGFDPAKVLFEFDGVRLDVAPGRISGKEVSLFSGAGINHPALKDLEYPTPVYSIPGNWIGRQPQNGGHSLKLSDNIAPCLTTMDRHGVVYFKPALGHGCQYDIQDYLAVRRLTPLEHERLQGFPDLYTQIPYNNKPAELCADDNRYAALGNSMPVDMMRWLGRRIDQHLRGGQC